ncbi:MAG: FG-GAP-like repeat-containing protein [Bacteroidota bacterium]
MRSFLYSTTPIVLLILLLPFCLRAQPQFTDVTNEAGINHSFLVFQGTFGGGAAVIDYDNDGWEDLFLAGGRGENQLLKNMGNGSFQNVSISAGLDALEGFVSQGAAVADVNKDGWQDLFITTITKIDGDEFTEASNVLLINQQNGRFKDQSEAYGIVETTFSSAASFGDVNGDGYPDLYVGNYFEDYEGSLDQFAGPTIGGEIQPALDQFYINDRGRKFVEVSHIYGIASRGLTFQGLWTDFDNDKDLDLIVANDFGNRATPNQLYRNEFPEARFSEISQIKNFDFGINGMGIAACDINQDGWLDYIISNIQVSPFFINQGPTRAFTEESIPRGTGYFIVNTNEGHRITPVSWGLNFFDFDHDMDQDLYITNGCLNPSLTPSPNLMLENTDGHFEDLAPSLQTNDHSIGRGSVELDFDHDGDLDLLVVNQATFNNEDIGVPLLGTRLYRNDSPTTNNWLKVKLTGLRSDANGIGSRLEAYVGGKQLIREIYAGSSHQSQNSLIAHFGLGEHTQLDSLAIQWIGGNRQTLFQVQANQTIEILEEVDSSPYSSVEFTVYPTYFDQTLSIKFASPEFTSFSLTVIDASGRRIEELAENGQDFGSTYVWKVPNSLAPGLYLFVLKTDAGVFLKKGVRL